MTEKLTQEEADIKLAAYALAMSGFGQSMVLLAETAARMAKAGMELSQAIAKQDQSSAGQPKE